MKNLTETIAELQREQAMRIKVWKGTQIPGKVIFHSKKHQHQFDCVANLIEILKSITERNWIAMGKLRNEKNEQKAKAAKVVQSQLFN